MSKIDKLIARHCPDGVKHITLGAIGTFTRGNGIQKSDFRPTGPGCIHYGQIHTHFGTWANNTISHIDTELFQKLRKAQKGDLVIATTSEDDHAAAKPAAEAAKPHDHEHADAAKTEPAKDAPAKPYPLKTCIVSDNDLDSMGEQASFVYQGQTIKVCCKSCIAKFEKNPAKYLKKLEGK